MKSLPWLNAAGAGALILFLGSPSVLAAPWSFGIMSDTQWPTSPDTKNPNVAVNIVNHLNQQFIAHGVKFVVQVGDLTDKPSTVVANPATTENLDIRAAFAQALYNAGIGFYPLRGNHEDKPPAPSGTTPATAFFGTHARETQRIFPQTQTGVNNQTPADARIATSYYGAPLVNTGTTFTVGSNFASEPTLEGLTYSFDYNNARFVLIDQFTKPAGTSHSNLDATDVAWIGGRFADPARPEHAFSFAHKGLITENHDDNLFNSSNPDASSGAPWPLTNTFMSSLYNNGVRYHFCGHDHMHNRAIVTSPDGLSKVQNIIAASDSYKFYIPKTPMASWHNRETQIAQEIFTVGYYIVTIDGPRVNVDHYASPNGCDGDCDQTNDRIPYTFTKRESFGYSLNGREVVVPQGGDLALTDDTSMAVARGETGYVGTQMAILAGTNTSGGKDWYNRPLAKAIDTGWSPKDATTASDVLTLWGLHDSLATNTNPASTAPTYNYSYDLTRDQTDLYVLSMSFNPAGISEKKLASGLFGLATRDAEGHWVNAVRANFGGEGSFVQGPHVPGDTLGTYGVDTATHTAWAVVNHQGEFAVADFAKGAPRLYALISSKAGPAGARVWTLKLINGPEPVEGAKIDNLTLTQTGGAACTPVLGKPTVKSGIDVLTPYTRPAGDIGPSDSAVNSIQLDFSTCAATARFTATIDYSADGGVIGTKTLYNQFR